MSYGWRERALCKGEPIDKWTVAENVSVASEESRARMQCAGCPVKRECGVSAILTESEGVIRGGYALPSARNRLAAVRKRMRSELGMEKVLGCSNCHRALPPYVGNRPASARLLCLECKRAHEHAVNDRIMMEKEMKNLIRRRKELGALASHDYSQRKVVLGR